MKIVLIGYMGVGKTAVGKHLAATLNATFYDLDNLIEINEKKTISQIFEENGEIYFRKKEYTSLISVINSDKDFILSTGGGTPCYGNSTELLKSNEEVVTIYLKASIPLLTNRLFQEKSERPLISQIENEADLNDFIRKHLFERSYYYNQAKLIVDVDDKTVQEIVENIVVALF